MRFTDCSATVPLDTLIWCVPKAFPTETPKLTTVIMGVSGTRIMTGGHDAADFLYGDVVPVPTVDDKPSRNLNLKGPWKCPVCGDTLDNQGVVDVSTQGHHRERVDLFCHRCRGNFVFRVRYPRVG
jgi:hypothetical protein